MYIQARDNYPYNVEECIEKLQYVIAADDEHAGANCLMGRIYEEQLDDYKQAEYYYRMTLYLDREHTPVYYQYAALLINLDRLDEALKLIDASQTVPGIDMARMHCLTGQLYEKYEMYATATDFYTLAKKACLNTAFMYSIDEHIKRVKDKKALDKKSKRKESKKTKKELS